MGIADHQWLTLVSQSTRRAIGLTSLTAGRTTASSALPYSLASSITAPRLITWEPVFLRLGDTLDVSYFRNLLFFSFFFFISI